MATRTIESIHAKCVDKFTTLRTVAAELSQQRLLFKMQDEEQSYNLAVASCLTEYQNNKQLASTYLKIATEYVVKMDEIADSMIRFIRLNSKHLKKAWVDRTVKLLESKTIVINVNTIEYENCCGQKMTILSDTSEVKCELCGAIKTIYGMVFRDDQFYTQDGQKTKHGDYRAARHLTFWIDRIQAKERCDFPDDHIAILRKRMNRDRLSNDRLTCDIMREYLSDCNLPQYNDHAALLMKQLTGIEPPQLDANEERDITLKFNAIVEMHDKIGGSSSTSRKYYPYYLYKIVEQKYPHGDERRKLLKYIHMQADGTVIKKDGVFKSIIDKIGDEIGMKYKPTNYISHC